MCILQLEISRKQKIIITSNTFDFYHYASSSCFMPDKNGTENENEIAGIGRRENADHPVEQPGLMMKLLYH